MEASRSWMIWMITGQPGTIRRNGLLWSKIFRTWRLTSQSELLFSGKHQPSALVPRTLELTMFCSGDVHLAAIGQFYSNPKLGIPKDKDFRYMPNIISSAIVNTPPPDMLADVLNKRNKVHHFDRDTDEDMIPMFQQGVDGKPRNNKHLLPHRNWCSIRLYTPGSTPESTPGQSVNDINAYGLPPNKPSLLRRLSLSKQRSKTAGPTYRGPDSVQQRDRTRPPISNALLRTLSRRGPSASADQVVPGGRGSPAASAGGKPPGLLKRTLSGSSISGRVGEFFRRRSSVSGQRPRVDDGGINGTWGAESDDENAVYDDYAHVSDEYNMPKIRGGGDRGMSAATTVGLRGGGGDYTPGGNEFVAGDESYFTAKPVSGGNSGHRRGVESAGSNYYPSPPISGGRGGGPTSMGMFQQQQSQQAARTSASLPERDFAPSHYSQPSPRGGIFRSATTGGGGRAIKRGEAIPHVMTEGALEVTLNVEISPRDPGGSTVPYRLLVPKLSYEYEGEDHDDQHGEHEHEHEHEQDHDLRENIHGHEHEPEMNAMVGEEHTLSQGQLQAFMESRRREEEMQMPPMEKQRRGSSGGIRRLLSLKRNGR